MHLKETKKQGKNQKNNYIQHPAVACRQNGTSSMAETSSSMSVFADLGIPEDAWMSQEVGKRLVNGL